MGIEKNEIDALYEISNNLTKKSRNLRYISFVLIALTFSSIPLFFFDRAKDRDIENHHSLEFYIDTLDNNQPIISDIDIVKGIVLDLAKSFNENSLKQSIVFYADTLERFYLKTNILLKEVKKEIHYHSKKYPNSTIEFNPDEIFISKRKNNYLVYFEGNYKKDKKSKNQKILYEIKVNKKFKITYIRNYQSRRSNTIQIDSLNNLFQIINPNAEILLKLDSMKN